MHSTLYHNTDKGKKYSIYFNKLDHLTIFRILLLTLDTDSNFGLKSYETFLGKGKDGGLERNVQTESGFYINGREKINEMMNAVIILLKEVNQDQTTESSSSTPSQRSVSSTIDHVERVQRSISSTT